MADSLPDETKELARRRVVSWMNHQRHATPGAYLRVIASGTVRGGDSIVVLDRPNHEVTIDLVFRALTLEPELLPRVLEADAFPTRSRSKLVAVFVLDGRPTRADASK